MTRKYDYEIVDFMPKQHRSSSSLPTQGHHLKLYRQRAEKNLCNNFLSLQITSYWNSLPDKVVQAPNTKTFESRLDQYWKKILCTQLDPISWPWGYVWLCFQSSDPIAPGWERGLNSWPQGHEFYNIECPIKYRV